ncbi:Sua5/YciO/YrdC/YwlC family protein [Alteromonas sp. 5E99-2]|uniref:Sua5/YciO/YrdC/YwlC family protein n=1 Tax=Alteromonas sp. 5E99-2 TaxID=2817683 RepID=UPI001A98D5CA|nr:Sua5/YciO/YrdC/YwlC family protein [Alteromonas sp. 5E99-2]MBO1256812.1 Sua5/YciO/YrdC/YwlC family protein [Alteromonas sp. 5E99-2]
MNQSNEIQHDTLKVAFDEGEIIVYPTEAVMGMGCDPDNELAVSKLLSLKKRNVDKGLILVAANYSQLLPYVEDSAIPPGRRPDIFSSWPGPITWLMPKASKAPKWITGQHAKIAVRVTSYPPLIALCERLGKPIVSTSANLSGEPSCISKQDVESQFGEQVVYVDGDVEGRHSPSTIKDAVSGNTVRG